MNNEQFEKLLREITIIAEALDAASSEMPTPCDRIAITAMNGLLSSGWMQTPYKRTEKELVDTVYKISYAMMERWGIK